MSESSAKSTDTNVSVFSMSGTTSDDAQAEVFAMMASGSAEQALDILLTQAASPGPQLAGGIYNGTVIGPPTRGKLGKPSWTTTDTDTGGG